MRVIPTLKMLIIFLGFLAHNNAFNLTTGEHNGNILVRFKESVKKAPIEKAAHAFGATVLKAFDHPKNLKLVNVPKGISFERTLERFQKDPNVLYAEPDYLLHINASKLTEPGISDPKFSEQWYLHNDGETGGTPDVDINAPEAWRFIDPEEKVIIAIVDTGINLAHPELKNRLWVNTLEIPDNQIDDDQNGYIDDIHGINAIDQNLTPEDDHGHGSSIAGIIGAEGNNDEGGRGIVPNVSIISCKFLGASGGGTTSDAISCLDYLLALKTRAIKPENIIASNNSWGGGPFSQALYDAIEAHRDAGMLFVTVAPAHGSNNDEEEVYPCNYQLDNILTAVATDNQDRLSDFSSFGKKTIHVGAPGVEILGIHTGSTYETFTGNSFAAAALTGLVGLINAFDPGLPFFKIRNLAVAGGTPVSALNDKTVSARRIRAWDRNGLGSLSCHDQVVSSRLSPLKDRSVLVLGEKIIFSFININCAQPMGRSLEIFEKNGHAFTLYDNGEGVDQISSDGIFAAEWTANEAGNFEFVFPNDERLSITVYDKNDWEDYQFAQSTEFSYRQFLGTSLNASDDSVHTVTLTFPIHY